MKRTITVYQKNIQGREYHHDWSKSDLLCPHCGQPSVWEQNAGGGDYYVGETFVCVKCGREFTIQGPNPMGSDDEILQQLRKGIEDEIGG